MKKELKLIREVMKKEQVDLCLFKDADDHISEYNDPYFSAMEFISGFTGGDGTLVVTRKDAALWTDGRYFIQADNELKDSGIELMKEGEPGCPLIEDWIREHMENGQCLGFDGRCFSKASMDKLLFELKAKNVKIKADKDLTEEIWADRPSKKAEPVEILPEKYSGKTSESKFEEVREMLASRKAEVHVISAMDEIAWLLNMRGNDVPYCPVFDAFFVMDGDQKVLYVSENHLNGKAREYLAGLGVLIREDTEAVYEDCTKISGKTVFLDSESTSYRLAASFCESAELIFGTGPVALLKCLKNETEMENLRTAQLKDSIAVTRFMYRFKKNLEEQKELTELIASDMLHEFRKEQEGFLGESFETISAWGPNAAMCHYVTDPKKDVKVEAKSLYLVDSGGHYHEGSTDITRTWSCGPLTEEEKKAYTLTAVGNLHLASQIFPDGVSAMTVDLSAREAFWKNGMDYNHGTGHGVGYRLYVHEGPVSMRFRPVGRVKDNLLKEGVYISDEPGYYAEGKFGVRLENMELVKHAFTNEHHRFLRFETLTLVPFDRACMDVTYMSDEDIRRYNEYHESVYAALKDRLPEEERAWLEQLCSPLTR